MKKILTLLITLHLSCHVFAQSVTLSPEGFVLPNLAEAPVCTVNDQGKMYFNTTSKMILVCDGAQWKPSISQWAIGQSPQTINYNGKVGINTDIPQYELDVNGSARVSSFLYAVGGIAIGSTTPTTGLTITDGDLAITSTVDNKTWKFDYSDDNNYLTLKEDGTARMIFANGGNVGIGSVVPTAKLSVDGTGYFSGNLTVNGGNGIVKTTTAASYKVHIAQLNLGATFSVLAGNCATNSPALNISSAGFTTAPTAQVGNLVSGTGNFGKLIINIDSTTATGVVVRFCNTTASNITLSNMVFNVLCIGQ